MKALERIFLYTVLAILVFYVFLIDSKVEGKVAIQEEIVARHITIMNDAGRPVVVLSAYKDGNGGIDIYNNSGNLVANTGASEDGGFMGIFNKAYIPVVVVVADEDGNGKIVVFNKSGKVMGGLP
ncbi:MAG: hypothetical protein IBV53_07920 [Candidatus Atribacteria bacterium]